MVAEEDSADLRAPDGGPMLLRITQLVNSVLKTQNASVAEEDVLRLIDLGGCPGGPQGRHWVLDPIDGTRGFVGMRQYAVCLGMLQDGEAVLGVLGCPNLPLSDVADDDGGASAADRHGPGVGCLFVAHRGHGAYMGPLFDEAQPLTPISVDEADGLQGARYMESYESRHSNHSLTADVASTAGVTLPPLRMDSQVKYGLLARGGGASIFMRFPPSSYREKIWDHCAGVVIVEEAGGKVTDAAGRRLDFSRGRFLELQREGDHVPQGIIAAPAKVHNALLQALEQVTSSPTST